MCLPYSAAARDGDTMHKRAEGAIAADRRAHTRSTGLRVTGKAKKGGGKKERTVLAIVVELDFWFCVMTDAVDAGATGKQRK